MQQRPKDCCKKNFHVIADPEKWTSLITNFILKVSVGTAYLPEGGTYYLLSVTV